ncbi:MAG TPA: hypothetical protein IAB59_05730 [Candidatus Onthousia faecipullorum]|uniref:Uncharacterized protein n=1 Tax=Candidatus Onthousia faecipullorum TaxID=2840887 RepID=A0A9D1GCE4_9FIRM|nr:hypothetical protein [Candidatus Onthousia faecipullorum]
MNFKSLLNNEQLLTILHNVLTNESTINKVSNVSINGEDYSYNQYSLLIVMDLVIKYQIIISDETYHSDFLSKLNNIITNYQSHQDLIIKCNSLLLELTSKKLNLKMTSRENKQLILKHIYNRYIINGYCFHSFPSVFKKDVEENGLISKIDKKEVYDLKKINYIFDHHNYKNLISKNLNSKSTPLYITDSPAMAYYYAFRSPEYMAELTSLSKYYNYIEDYDKSAYYLKDYQKCKSNLVSLCKHVNMTTKEENTVLKSFDRRWSSLKLSDSAPCIAFIKRSDLAKNSLPNINEIIEMVDEVELPILLSKITDSKYPVIRRYSDIDPLDLTVITMPSYKEIKNYHKKSKEELVDNIEIVEKRRRFNLRNAYSYGNASVLALSGLLFISLGLTLSIILKVLGG